MMNYFKKIFTNKGVGFYICLAMIVLSLVTGITHAICYATFQNQGATAISWPSVGLCFAIAVINIGLILFNKAQWAPFISLFCAIIALVLFIYNSYFYITVMATGIDDHFNPKYISNAVLFLLTFILSFVGIYFKVNKKEVKEEN